MSELLPVTLVTGFRGAGKSALIQSQLERAPSHERWGALLAGAPAGPRVNISNAPTWRAPALCPCCVGQTAFHHTLVSALRDKTLTRLFIELPHTALPEAVLSMIRQPGLAARLQLQARWVVLALQRLAQPRYREHELYLEQIKRSEHLFLMCADTPEETRDALLSSTLEWLNTLIMPEAEISILL